MEKDRRLFIVLLLVLMGGIFAFSLVPEKISVFEEIEDNIDVEELPLENESLELTYDDNGTVMLSGQGELSSLDLSNLITNADILISDIENIIIADGITEIGYDAINGFDYLNSIKFPNTIKKIHNGAVKNCVNLKWVYLPSGIKKVAQDFLYGVARCYVISDGQISLLIEASKVENVSIVENIVSYEDLHEKMNQNEVIFQSISTEQLMTNDPESGINPIVLHKKCIQYGPYTTMEKGKYTIHLLGKGFGGLTTDAPYINIEGYLGEIDITNKIITDEMISYNLELSEGTSGVEFCLNNNSNTEVEIYELQIFEMIELPNVIKEWW